MTDFTVLDKVLKGLSQTSVEDKTTDNTCMHVNTSKDRDRYTCLDCGIEVPPPVEKIPTKLTQGRIRLEPNRCQIRKNPEKTIDRDVQSYNFSESVVRTANEIFTKTTKGKIFRGNSRKAIIFACVFHAYKILGTPQSCESLINVFSLDRKVGLRGLKHVAMHAPKNSKLRTTHITPEDLVKEIMKKFSALPAQIDSVIVLYGKIKNRSSVLNRSRPQSVAAGLTYYYILMKQKDISLREFTKEVNLSELTVTKITKEISKVLTEHHKYPIPAGISI
jgi:transcription initiation factor TFIIIB Brf1 subunit/transcription initiation factor TFIIB